MITIKQLIYALTVARTLHFKKAADECAVSQSALSSALNELEKQLGINIFERDNKRVLITQAGKQVLENAQSIKMKVDDLEKLAHASKKPFNYPMKIGIIPTICPYILPHILPELHKQYPDFQLEIIEEQSHILVDKVKRGELDTAILALPFPCDGLLTFEFWQEDFYWITHKDDRMIDRIEITPHELKQKKLMLLNDGHCLKDHALAACKLSNVGQHALGATSLATLIQLVVAKIGTTLLPKMTLEQLVIPNKSLISIRLNEPGPHRKIAFISRPNYPNVDNIEVLIHLLKKLFKTVM